MSTSPPIYVTKPYMPPLEEFMPYLEKIWESQHLTNSGPYHQKLELALDQYLGVENLALTSNGTVALMLALRGLEVEGEVITTPFSFVATAHSLRWAGIQPVFVDIDPVTFNLDPDKIEAAITPATTAIMPVHVYGNPCDVERIEQIAKKHNLKVIYDAAHAFGVAYKGESLLNHGDMSCLSFHATKVFNTFEGGAIISKTVDQKERINFLKNFGFENETTIMATGINGKMNEIQAAFGLLQLNTIDEAINKRKIVDGIYRKLLKNIEGIKVPEKPKNTIHNYSYFPVVIDNDYPISRDELYEKLKNAGIYTRRYFYPLITDFPMYKDHPSSHADNLPVAIEVAKKILCLPIYPDLLLGDQERICKVVAL